MIRQARNSDKEQIINLFCENIKVQTSYISHGEIQMGLALNTELLSKNHIELWGAYLNSQMKQFEETVLVHEENETINGFIIGEIANDRSNDFGVICDIVVDNSMRNKGIGALLLNSLLAIYKSKGIYDFYLESGIKNHEAHQFFENKGFSKVSVIYRRNDK